MSDSCGRRKEEDSQRRTLWILQFDFRKAKFGMLFCVVVNTMQGRPERNNITYINNNKHNSIPATCNKKHAKPYSPEILRETLHAPRP